MTPLKKTLTAAGLGTAMFVGGVFGAATADVDSVGAQDADTPADEGTQGQPEADQSDRDTRRAEREASKTERRDAMAELLGVTAEELSEALRSGSTIAEVAETQGVDVQLVIDYIVEQAGDRIDQAVIDGNLTDEEAAEKLAGAAERAEAVVNGEANRRGHRGHRGMSGKSGQRSAALAEVLGLTTDELREAKQGGATIAEIAEANGVSVAAVVDALVAEATERVEGAVENGRLTEDEAADKLAEVEEKIEAMVNGEADGRRGRMGEGRGQRSGQRGSGPVQDVTA